MYNGKISINGKALSEPCVMDDSENASTETTEMKERLVPEGELFMLGQPKNSNDSRHWGFAYKADLIGTTTENNK